MEKIKTWVHRSISLKDIKDILVFHFRKDMVIWYGYKWFANKKETKNEALDHCYNNIWSNISYTKKMYTGVFVFLKKRHYCFQMFKINMRGLTKLNIY